MDHPMISIITPTFNRADFIIKALESVKVQTYENFEHIIVDDGSTDDTRERLKPFLKDPRFHYFYQENQGQSTARNLALSKMRGEFVCFLDSDNFWVHDKLADQISILYEKPGVDVVYGDLITINQAGEEMSRQNIPRFSGSISLQMLKDNCVSMNTAMARRKCFDELGGMSGKYRVADDYDLWLRFSARYRFQYVPQYFAYYRVMEKQISSDKSARFAANELIINDFRKNFPDALTSAEFAEGFAYFYTRKARYLAGSGKLGSAYLALIQAIREKPFYSVPWRALLAVTLKKFS